MKRRGHIKMYAVYFDNNGERTNHIETIDGGMTITQGMNYCKGKALPNESSFAYTTRPESGHYNSQKFHVR